MYQATQKPRTEFDVLREGVRMFVSLSLCFRFGIEADARCAGNLSTAHRPSQTSISHRGVLSPHVDYRDYVSESGAHDGTGTRADSESAP